MKERFLCACVEKENERIRGKRERIGSRRQCERGRIDAFARPKLIGNSEFILRNTLVF